MRETSRKDKNSVIGSAGNRSEFMIVNDLAQKENRLNEIQDEILFDNRLKLQAQLRKGVKPREKNITYYILKWIEFIAVFLFIVVIPITY